MSLPRASAKGRADDDMVDRSSTVSCTSTRKTSSNAARVKMVAQLDSIVITLVMIIGMHNKAH
jgi:hypothetical protein